MYRLVHPVINYTVRDLCKKEYHNHSKGCPNWNKKSGCPPQAKKIVDIIDLNNSVFAIWNRFNIGEHISNMQIKHPEWTEYQLRCCLYWQGRARKNLKGCIEEFKYWYKGYVILICPEANGVNVTATMQQIGIKLEWPPVRYSYQIVLAGKRT